MENFKAEIIADSLNERDDRLTTFVVVFPRIVLAEFNTHRMLSRNSASSRAVPFEKMLKRVMENPFIPLKWMKDHKGMQGAEYFASGYTFSHPCTKAIGGIDTSSHEYLWLKARDKAVKFAKLLSDSGGLTKQIVNRLLEPWMYHTVIVTATDWQNFFALRAHDAAEIHIQKLAYMMLEEYNVHEPTTLRPGEWHIPFGDKMDKDRLKNLSKKMVATPDELKIKIATARCARVSYINYDGNDDYVADLKLHDTLAGMGHWSCFEHCAQNVTSSQERSGNFKGFEQYRKIFAGENRGDARVKIK